MAIVPTLYSIGYTALNYTGLHDNFAMRQKADSIQKLGDCFNQNKQIKIWITYSVTVLSKSEKVL